MSHLAPTGRPGLFLTAVLATLLPASGGVMSYYGIDPNTSASQAHPNADATALSFMNAVQANGSSTTISYEGLPIAYATVTPVAQGVTITQLNGANANGAGISNDTSFNPVRYGYNITPGGSQFYRFDPVVNSGNASFTFNFDSPVQAFGTYITGVGTASPASLLALTFNDGSNQSLAIPGDPSGGALYIGFTDFGASVSSVTLQFSQVTDDDVISLDNTSYSRSRAFNLQPDAAVPEPATLTLTGLAITAAALARRFRSQSA